MGLPSTIASLPSGRLLCPYIGMAIDLNMFREQKGGLFPESWLLLGLDAIDDDKYDDLNLLLNDSNATWRLTYRFERFFLAIKR